MKPKQNRSLENIFEGLVASHRYPESAAKRARHPLRESAYTIGPDDPIYAKLNHPRVEEVMLDDEDALTPPRDLRTNSHTELITTTKAGKYYAHYDTRDGYSIESPKGNMYNLAEAVSYYGDKRSRSGGTTTDIIFIIKELKNHSGLDEVIGYVFGATMPDYIFEACVDEIESYEAGAKPDFKIDFD